MLENSETVKCNFDEFHLAKIIGSKLGKIAKKMVNEDEELD